MVMGEHRSAQAHAKGGNTALRALWAAVLLVSLLAFTWHSFVTQTHRHWGGQGYTLGVAVEVLAGAPAQKSGQKPADTPDNCPICQEVAHGGAYLAPAPILLDAPAILAAWFTVTLLLALALRQQSPAWRSRAPPIGIQA